MDVHGGQRRAVRAHDRLRAHAVVHVLRPDYVAAGACHGADRHHDRHQRHARQSGVGLAVVHGHDWHPDRKDYAGWRRGHRPAPFPRLLGTSTPTASLHYDAYTFPICGAAAVSSCTPITLDGVNTAPIRSAAFKPSFNPASLAENYLGDSGGSFVTQNFSVDTQGSGPLVVTVYRGDPERRRRHLVSPAAHRHVRELRPQRRADSGGAQHDGDGRRRLGRRSSSIDNGSSDPDGDPLTITQSPAGPYPVGVTTVLLTVTDPKGAASQATATVTVLVAPPPPTVTRVPAPA